MQYRRLFCRILYGSVYLVLFLALISLLLVTPGDAIQRSLQNGQKYNVLIVTISYVVTVMTVAFVYILRLYINKTALAAIPKAWVPIEKGDVRDAVYRMIHGGLNRSAVIAYAARPREHTVDLDGTPLGAGDDAGEPILESKTRAKGAKGAKGAKSKADDDPGLPLPTPGRPVWGEIEHDGWASPTSLDLRNLQYSSVVCELPNLIEAKALSLALAAQSAEATGLLQRVPCMTMPDYLDHLSSVGVLPPVDDESTTATTTALFLTRYEYARYSNRPLSNQLFRELMHLFAEVLRAMRPLDPSVLQSLDGDGDGDGDDDGNNESDTSYGWGPSGSDADIDNDAPLDTNPPSPRSSISRSTMSSMRRRPQPQPQPQPPSTRTRTPSTHAWSFCTAPNTPRSRRTATETGTVTGMLSRTSSGDSSFAPARGPQQQQHTVASQPSNSSFCSKSTRSTTGSTDSGSVIRLATEDDPDALPYVLNLRPTA
ncbi:hypothetical protein E4U42_000944 [Claviceps africana]|uniref:Defect at low temperature protein 1 n=1 Tax=Claviceps africana TaxID=83212 RepID=A0A8K0JA86_9HYPO|nr:hypothetical protein E4U42_000944 [Claviceps africana]